MNITTEPAEERWHDLQDPGAYEWWYFDIEDPQSGVSIVVIWFAGFPFSPSYQEHYERWQRNGAGGSDGAPAPLDYAGFSFQLYEQGRETINFIREGRRGLFESSRTAVGAAFEKSRFTYDALRDEYRLSIDFDFPARQKSVQAELLFSACRTVDYRRRDGNNEGAVPCHQWLLRVPRAEVSGRVEVSDARPGVASRRIEVRADGYHDHNLGTMPMQEYISRWYWGRAFSERVDVIYYVIFFRNPAFKPLTLLMLGDNLRGGTVVRDGAGFSESRFTRGFFAPPHGRELRITDGDVAITIDQQRVLDAGPFYLRFSSSISLELDGERIDGLGGISEFLSPVRLESRFMRFFTRSRVWRDGEESAMYRRYNFIKDRLDWFKR
ncbi:carotenoid 1,2-hydratase [Chlorobium sp. N1]|uniref:carotenoid 1,2-hydratase n=1 Tax=Chlorobium sp. N1 TaxID=2491138 RepID=UPI00103E348C|nr:carotenoid 1,2-hydratase [Chlorobium sp. N1]TCD48849.1 carotenoid 1,2-hydratase [Chlorobium sp. N1]